MKKGLMLMIYLKNSLQELLQLMIKIFSIDKKN